MKLPEMKPPTKAQIEASNNYKREKEILRDIHKIDVAIQNADPAEMESLHRYLDGKYQYGIADWGKSMYGYQEIIEDYNSQQDRANIEKTFDELMDLVQNMDQEEQRYVREGFSSDEELSLYDMLFSENLSKQDIQKIKKVAVDLLQKVKSKIAELDHWTDKQETKATIDTLIRDTLWLELPECYDELRISEYRQRIYEYVYTRYKGVA